MKKMLLVTMLCMVTVVGTACRRTPAGAQRQWGQGYETQAGYYEPDHSFLYYWMWYHLLFSNQQPTYHVYVPPAGYPNTYRPWQGAPKSVAPAVRTTAPVPQSGSFRSTGAYSAPAAPSSGFRLGGAYSAPRPSAPSFRSSGGYSSPSSSFRSSSGFRSSGGFRR